MLRTIDRLRAARREDRGFTLIELLIVIVILGILAAIVVFSVRAITDRGEVSACRADVKTAAVAVEAHYAKEKAYPASLAELVTEGYLRSDPTASVTYTQADGSTVGKAPCAGYAG